MSRLPRDCMMMRFNPSFFVSELMELRILSLGDGLRDAGMLNGLSSRRRAMADARGAGLAVCCKCGQQVTARVTGGTHTRRKGLAFGAV